MTDYRILYNDRCPICRAEISQYRAKAARHSAPLVFDDLNDSDLASWGLTPDQAARRLHALTPAGELLSGIPAFAVIWAHLPGLRWMARAVSLPVVGPLVRWGYDRIAAPWLYNRQRRREAAGRATVPRRAE